MNSNRSLNLHIIFICGLVYALLFSVWQNSLQVMYPNEHEQASFLSFFRGMAFIAVALSLFIPIKVAEGWIMVGAIIFLLLSLGSIFTGHWAAYELKTDEFLFYFTVAATSILAFLAVLTVLIKYLFSNARTSSHKLMITGALGAVSGYALFSFTENAPSIHAFHAWYAIIPLVLLVFFFYLKEQRTELLTS